MSILVIGAGELGTAMLKALVNHPSRGNAQISVLLRPSTITSQNTAKRQSVDELRSWGVQLETGEIVEAPASELAKTFAKYDTVIGCAGLSLPKGTQVKLSQAVLEAKTRRYIPWQFGVDYDMIGEGNTQDLFDEQLEVRKMLRSQSETDWIIVSTGLFMSFLFVPEFGVVDLEKKIVRALGSWENKVTITTPDDIAAMTAEVAMCPGDLSSQVVFVGGDTVSYGHVAELVTAKFGSDFKREEWDLQFLAKELETNPGNTYAKYQGVFGDGRGVWWDMAATLNARRGIKLTSLSEYLGQM